MTRLDQNRASAILAKKAGAPVSAVSRMTIWGNHSDTQYPDYKNARINGKPATTVINDAAWFEETFHTDRRQTWLSRDQGPRCIVGGIRRERATPSISLRSINLATPS